MGGGGDHGPQDQTCNPRNPGNVTKKIQLAPCLHEEKGKSDRGGPGNVGLREGLSTSLSAIFTMVCRAEIGTIPSFPLILAMEYFTGSYCYCYCYDAPNGKEAKENAVIEDRMGGQKENAWTVRREI